MIKQRVKKDEDYVDLDCAHITVFESYVYIYDEWEYTYDLLEKRPRSVFSYLEIYHDQIQAT